MHRRLPLLFRPIACGLRGGCLVRPFVIALVLGAAGGILSSLEEQMPTLSAWVPTILFPSRQDPQVAQVILRAIATSIMTVVSIDVTRLLLDRKSATAITEEIHAIIRAETGLNASTGVSYNILTAFSDPGKMKGQVAHLAAILRPAHNRSAAKTVG
jgi:hypothetical protein